MRAYQLEPAAKTHKQRLAHGIYRPKWLWISHAFHLWIRLTADVNFLFGCYLLCILFFLQAITKEEPSVITAALSRLQICRLCRHRLLHGPSFHCYGFPRKLLEENAHKEESAHCSLCFGLLCNLSAVKADGDNGQETLANTAIGQIVEKVKESRLDFSAFQINVSCIRALMENILWLCWWRMC